MNKKNKLLSAVVVLAVVFTVFISPGSWSYLLGKTKPLLLQEMTWPNVKEYLETCDMVIIPLGATEQHGPHLPLGTDYYQALEMSKLISIRTGVVVAPVIMSGYSLYHTGFSGSLTLNPETMEQVLFETVEILITYGFRKIVFFNSHGGNNDIEKSVIFRINQDTEAVAIDLGIYSSLQKIRRSAYLDWHAGIDETSLMLYLKPELVNMELAEKPVLKLPPPMLEMERYSREIPHFWEVMLGHFFVPAGNKKGGAIHEVSNNGIITYGDPKKASKERGKKLADKYLENAVTFIKNWKKVKM